MSSGNDEVSHNQVIPHEQSMPPFTGAQSRCFGCGPNNPAGLKLTFTLAEDGAAIASAVVANLYEGPPGCVHGGIIATLLDEAMSKANRARGVAAMTRQMQVDYLRPVPSGLPIRIEGRVTRIEGRKHWTSARILNAEGKVLAEATALFLTVRRPS